MHSHVKAVLPQPVVTQRVPAETLVLDVAKHTGDTRVVN